MITFYSLPGKNWQKLPGNSKGTFNSWDEANAYLNTLEGSKATSEGDGEESEGNLKDSQVSETVSANPP